jgi:heat shock protein HslJ
MHHILRYAYLLALLVIVSACILEKKNQQYSEVEGASLLKGSYWMLVSLQGQELPDDPHSNSAYIRFEEKDNELKGYTGCNRLSGRYQLSDSSLHLTSLSTTRAMCQTIEQENFLMAILKEVDSYRISGEILTLFHRNTAVATFRAGNPNMFPDDE